MVYSQKIELSKSYHFIILDIIVVFVKKSLIFKLQA
jgi:hypothetical protein